MAEMKWNEEQKQAITTNDGAVLVSAAAGSGKTAVLVERVIQMLTDKSRDIRADQLLIVTFTNLAAEEMKTRINKRITQLLEECASNPELDERYLRNQQLLLDKAHISTIDSFCKEIVTSEYTRFDISPDYRIGDSAELKAMQYTAVEQVAEAYYEREDFAPIASLLTTTSGDSELKSTIVDLHTFLSALPFPEKWLSNTLESFENAKGNVFESVWIQNIMENIRLDIEYAKGIMKSNSRIYMLMDNSDDIINASSKRFEQHKTEREFIKQLGECETWEEIKQFTSGSSVFSERIVSVKGLSEYGKQLNEEYKANREIIKKLIGKIADKTAYEKSELEQELELIHSAVKVLFEFVTDFSKLYAQLKKDKNILDFSDLERFTLLTLAQPDDNGEFSVDDSENSIHYNITQRAREISSTFKEVIVDEYQDVNQLQDIIFRILSDNNKNLFVVGDVKQSIYGFRQAMPDIFINRRKSYNIQPDNIAKNIILKRNYRSRDGVTDFVNFVFANLMQKELGGLEYLPEDYLIAGADYKKTNKADVYVHLNNLTERNEKSRELIEAKRIANIIKNTVGIYDVKSGDITRKAEYKDIAILMRDLKRTAILKEYLEQNLIPVITETKGSLLDCKEVQMVIDLLRVIDNPRQDIPLYSVLVSPMFGFTPQRIAQIRCNEEDGRKKPLYVNILTEAKTDDLTRQFVKDIEYYREISANNPTDELINIIYRKTAITEYVKALENGESILNNLRMLYSISKGFEDNRNKGISSFIRYIDRAEESGAVIESESGVNTEGNSVRIMTIHHSKGLEFPICILTNVGKKPIGFTKKMYIDRDLGIGLKLRGTEKPAIYNTFSYTAVVNKLKSDDIAEDLRVLYVALTRAKEQLHIIGSAQNIYKRITAISQEIAMYGKINSNVIINKNKVIDWLIAVILMMKPTDGNKNILWKYASEIFKEDIAHNPEFNFVEHKEISVDLYNVEEDSGEAEKAEPLIDDGVEIISKREIDIEMLDKRFSTEYRYQNAVDIPSVVTPSSIVHRKFNILGKFAFENKSHLTSAQRGTAMHKFMECADLHEALISPQAEIRRLVKSGYLSEKQGECISPAFVKRCLNTEVMQRYMKSPKQYKEIKFEAMVKACVTGFGDCEEEHLLRGSVDSAFEEDGGLVIIDYKTDKAESMEELKEKYHEQLELYKIGLSATLNLPVKQCVIYSFWLNDFIEIG